jgi:signal transduction histidine kinase
MSDDSRPNDLVEWIVISLRWLTLIGLMVGITAGASPSLAVILTIMLAAIVNLVFSLLAAFGKRLPIHPYVSVFFDLLVACPLFLFSGAVNGDIGWAILLPSMTASIYFGLAGGAITTLIGLFLLGLFSIIASGILSTLVFLVTLIPLCLFVVLLFGSLSNQLRSGIARAQQVSAASRLDGLHTDSGWLSAMFKLMAELNASLNYQRVLEKALDLSSGALGNKDAERDQLVSAVLLYSKRKSGNPHLQVGSARRFTQADMRISLPGTGGLIGQAIDEGEARLSRDIASDAELGRIVSLHACSSAYCIPLRAGLDTYGVLLFGHPKSDFFTPQRQKVLEMIASQSMIAIQNARLYRDLEQEKERMIEIQDEARSKLARDLHDGPTQSIAAIAMRVNYARRLLERDPKTAARELFKIEELARQTTMEIRHMLFTLRPLILESQGLEAALQSMADKIRETYSQEVLIAVDPAVASQLELSKQGVVFNITEEAVNNARKHAQAAHIKVRLRFAGKELALLEIEDDGIGFDLQAVNSNYESRGSLGMVNMRERTDLLNGYLKISSKPGEGTLVAIVIPLTEAAMEESHRIL